MALTHIIGAGLAGLAAALSRVDQHSPVAIYESAAVAGGRCRSYFDKLLDHRIDNGNHLLLSGNEAAFAYLDRINARVSMAGPKSPIFPFIDRASHERWTLRLSRGKIPWWMLRASTRVPGTRLTEYFRLLRLLSAGPECTVASFASEGPLFRRLIEPLAIASLNTEPKAGSAALFAAIVKQTLMQGGMACIPRFPRDGLSESLVDPAIAILQQCNARLHFNRRIAGLQIVNNRVTALLSSDGPIIVGPHDDVIMAVPAPVATELVPGLVAPDQFRAIVNVHFRVDADPGEAGFTGVVGGVAEWVFVKPGIASVTISAADAMVDQTAEAIAAAVWPDVAAVCGIAMTQLPPWRVIKEKRATFAATPAQERRRPPTRTAVNNLVLAGDWTATGLPATIEGAIRSGRNAAMALWQRDTYA
jgi:squalene-associated FAD-dependent desaturase